MTHELRIFLWAAHQSPEFNQCYIELPSLWLRYWNEEFIGVWTVELSFRRRFKVFVPWSVEREYQYAHGLRVRDEFDDIPF